MKEAAYHRTWSCRVDNSPRRRHAPKAASASKKPLAVLWRYAAELTVPTPARNPLARRWA
ncbi:MAG: hypothetical protein WKG07_04390 [Hymenobacter sp.]